MSSKDDYLNNGGPVFENNPAEIDKNVDGLKPDNTDLKRTTKKTLKDYLSDKSSINQFPIDKNHDETKPDASIYADPEGKTSPELKIHSPDVNENQFKPQFLQKERMVTRFNPGKLKDVITEGTINGNDLLNQWDYNQTAEDKRTNKPAKEVIDYVGRNLSLNRFSDNNEYGSNIGDKTFSIKKRKKDKSEADKHVDLSVDQLNEIASYLMLRASGKDAKPGESSMFIPGIQQLIPGTKLNGDQLNITRLIKDLSLNPDEQIVSSDSGQHRNSYGVLNNYFDRFEKTSVGTLALSAAIVTATNLAVLSAALPFALIITNRDVELDYNTNKIELPSDRKLRKDENLNYKKPSDITPTFEYITGIERSRFKNENRIYFASFYAEILRGGQIFFSLNNNALALLGSFGYYVNFCRSIVRDTFRIIDLFTPKNGESGLEYTDNMISYDTLQIVKNSKLIKCINLFIKLSDLQKDSEYKKQTNYLKLSLSDLNKKSEHNIDVNQGNIPFYFKDLRNNKIIQFYATLGDFSETYSPQWVEEHYYGRVDPIKFYKSTTRKISLNFKVFAYGQDDYKVMWDKLQDLTSLVYPTYTNKRVIEDGNNFIKVPFSQTFKSQPLIRVKLGDLITNNIGDIANFIETEPKDSSALPNDITIEKLFDEAELKSSYKRKNEINIKREDEFRKLREALATTITSEKNSYPEESVDITNNVIGTKLKFLFGKGCFSGNVHIDFYDTIKGLKYAQLIRNNPINEIPNSKSPHKMTKKPKNDPLLNEVGNILSKKTIRIDKSESQQTNINDIDQNHQFDLTNKNFTVEEIYVVSHKGNIATNKILIKSKALIDLIKKDYEEVRAEYNIDAFFDSINYISIAISDLKPKLWINTDENNIKNEDNPFYKAMQKVEGKGALAYVDSLSYKTMEGYQWEIDKDKGRRPRIIDVSMELTILHDIQPFSNGDNYKHRQDG